MKRLLLYSLLVVSFLMVMTQRMEAKTASPDQMTLTVCLMNDVGLPERTVGEVERGVEGLFGGSGISIRWILGGDEDRTEQEMWTCAHPEPLHVVILRWMPDGQSVRPNELGETFLDVNGMGVITDIFVDRVTRLHWERGVNLSTLLTHVSAHELGHLLLGLDSHSSSGLMLASINEQYLTKMTQGAAGFTREQEKRMHDRMKRAETASLMAQRRKPILGR